MMYKLTFLSAVSGLILEAEDIFLHGKRAHHFSTCFVKSIVKPIQITNNILS